MRGGRDTRINRVVYDITSKTAGTKEADGSTRFLREQTGISLAPIKDGMLPSDCFRRNVVLSFLGGGYRTLRYGAHLANRIVGWWGW